MSVLTEFLELFKYDPASDGAQTFNLKQALNDNWDKVDAFAKALNSAKGAADGIATLGKDGKLAASQLPSHAASHAAGGSDPLTLDDRYYKKVESLSPGSRTLYGLGSDAVPDDVLAFLGKYNQHWWQKTKRTYTMQLLAGQQLILSLASANATEKTISYASEIAFDEITGEVTMVNPTDIQVYYSGFSLSEFDVLNGKYVTSDYVSGIYYIDSDAVRDHWNTSKGYYCAIENPGAHLVRVSYTEDVKYLVSTDRSAYPDTGTSDGYEYEYLGIPFKNATAAPKIALGSYIGTGTAGEADPNSLTFESNPLLVIIFTEAPTVFVRNNNEAATHISADYGGYASVEWDGKTVNWHAKPGYWSGTSSSTTESATAEKQLNAPAQIYPYIALLR